MAKGVSIAYGDVAPEAKENFTATVSEKKYNTLGNLQRYNMPLYNYACPCEKYQTILDGTAIAFPSNSDTANIGLWSNRLSNDNGKFVNSNGAEEPIVLTLESTGQYSSQGFTFTFDKFNDIFPTKLTIQWFRVTSEGIADLSDGAIEFNPTSGQYFCRKQIDNFNKVVIKFYSMNMPQNRLKVEVIDYGYGTVFYGEELRNVKINQSIDPISSEIKINTCNFTLDSKSDMEYSFQAKQPLTVRFNDELIATTFVKSAKRKGKFLWDITAEDYIGNMGNVTFTGGIYNNTPVNDILLDIFTTAKVPYLTDDSFASVKLSGYIPYTTCREALMQVCFACQCVVNTANKDVVEIKSLSDEINQNIPLERILQGQSFTDNDTVTGIEITSHTYKPITETLDLYKAEDSGTGNNIIVKFSEPVHDLAIANGSFVKDSSGNELKGANYAVINANSNCVLSGQKYEHTELIHRKTNPVVLASEKENISSITSATLVSTDNIDNILDKCYNWLVKVNETNLKIVVGKDVSRGTKSIKWGELKWGEFNYGGVTTTEVITNQKDVCVGDNLKVATEYLGDVVGRLISTSFNLNGNIIIKESVLK